jgi:hypothetical protein
MRLIAWMMIGVVAAQFYFAGLGVFGATSFTVHALTGWVFILLAVALLVGSLVSKLRRRLAPLAALILLMSIAQPVLALGLRRWPWVAGVHPLVGLGIAALLTILATRSTAQSRS